MKNTSKTRIILFIAIVVFFLLFFYFPVFYFLFQGIFTTGEEGLAQLLDKVFFDEKLFFEVLSFTVYQSALSAIISIILAFPLAYFFAKYNFKFKKIIESVILIPFILPSMIVIISLISFYNNNIVLNKLAGLDFNKLLFGFPGIILAHVFYNVSVAFKLITEGYQSIDERYYEITKTFGEKPFKTFLRITLPLLIPYIASAFLIIFIYCFMSFAIILTFGGFKYITLEFKIYETVIIDLQYKLGSLYAVGQFVFSLLFMFISGNFINRFQTEKIKGFKYRLKKIKDKSKLFKTAFYGYISFILLFLAGPLISLIAKSFIVKEQFSFLNYVKLFSVNNIDVIGVDFYSVLFQSLLFAFLCGIFTLFVSFALGLIFRRKKSFIINFFILPIGISFVTYSLGLRILQIDIVSVLGDNFFTSLISSEIFSNFILVVIAQFFLTFPIVFRILRNSIENIGENYIEVGKSFGASYLQIIRDIIFPLMKKGLSNAGAYSFAIPFSEFTIVLILGQGFILTFPIAIYRLIGKYKYGFTNAIAVIYIVLCVGIFYLIEKISQKSEFSI